MVTKSRVFRLSATAIIAFVTVVAALVLLSRGGTPNALAEPRGDVPFGFWVTDSVSRSNAIDQVRARVGFAVANPEPPAGYELRSVWQRTSSVPGSASQAVLDYFGKGFVPPSAGPVDASVPHIQVVQWNGTATEGRPSTAFELGVPDYTASSVNLSADELKAAGNGGLYTVSGNGRSWTITVFAPGAPSRADLLPFLRSLTK